MNEQFFEITYKGNSIFGLRDIVFRFQLEIRARKYVYHWLNPPTVITNVLKPNQLRIQSKTKLTRVELLSCLDDIYEAYHEERNHKVL